MIPTTRGLISRLSIFEPKTTVIPATRELLQTKAAQHESESEENFQFLGLFGRKKMQVEILVQAPPRNSWHSPVTPVLPVPKPPVEGDPADEIPVTPPTASSGQRLQQADSPAVFPQQACRATPKVNPKLLSSQNPRGFPEAWGRKEASATLETHSCCPSALPKPSDAESPSQEIQLSCGTWLELLG